MKGAKRSEGLGIFAAIAFAVGNMIGAGVFVLSGIMIDLAGPSAVLSYLICGVLVAFSGLSYAALASIFPEDGGGYLYARHMLGEYPGFLAGWSMYISQIVVTSFVLLGLGIYLNLLLGSNFDPRFGALAGIILITALNLRGLSEAGKAEIIMVVTKVSILVVLAVFGMMQITSSDFVPFFSHGQKGVLEGMTSVFFAYLGFQVVAMMGGEVKEASKNVPLATLASIGIVAAIYTGVVVALLSARLSSYGSQSVFDASVVLLGASGGAIVAFAAVVSTLSAANANIIGASRVVLEMASEGQVPGRFARLKNDQPANSILLGSATTMFLIVYGSLNFIIDLTNVLVLITMFFVNVSAFILVKEEKNLPPEKNYFKIPFGGLFPALGAASCLLMLLTISIPTLGMGLLALLLGSILHFLEDTPQGRRTVEDIRELLGRR